MNWVDFDNDCYLDLFVTNESNQADDLYRNLGNGTFEKVTTGAPSQSSRSTMSSSWGDIDNDGDLDLVVSNGFCSGSIVNFLYQNDGNDNFTRDLESIEDLGTPCSFGTAWGDLNDDGFLDLGVTTCKNSSGSTAPENIFYQNLGNGNNWLKIKPVGTLANHSDIGAKVWVTATIGGQEVTQMREITTQSGYCGQSSLLAHFGLGDATMASEVHIQFSCDSDTTLTDVAVGQTLTVTEEMITSTSNILRSENYRILVSPNPASGDFLVEIFSENPLPPPTPEGEACPLQLLDSTGQLLWQKHLRIGGTYHLTVSISLTEIGLPAGMYFLKMGKETRKVVLVD